MDKQDELAAMETRHLPAGTVVSLGGIPVRLATSVAAETLAPNWAIANGNLERGKLPVIAALSAATGGDRG